MLLGCNDLSAELAERYGYINRAPPADELTPFVEKRAIPSFPAHAIAHAKATVDTGAFDAMAEALLLEPHKSDLSVATEVTQARVGEALKAGAETYEGEPEIDYLSRHITPRMRIAIWRMSVKVAPCERIPKRAGVPTVVRLQPTHRLHPKAVVSS